MIGNLNLWRRAVPSMEFPLWARMCLSHRATTRQAGDFEAVCYHDPRRSWGHGRATNTIATLPRAEKQNAQPVTWTVSQVDTLWKTSHM